MVVNIKIGNKDFGCGVLCGGAKLVKVGFVIVLVDCVYVYGFVYNVGKGWWVYIMVVVGGYYNYVFVGGIFDSLLYGCVFVFV